jgi:acyl-CoA thioesterase-1
MMHVLMIGDCTLATSYLPTPYKNERVLGNKLRDAYPQDECYVTNEGLDGESVAQFLKRYERTFSRHAPPDYIFVRYGVNDRRAYGPDGFQEQLLCLCERLRDDFPDARLLLETGMYVDYPAHYEWDRNRILQPIYDIVRKVAQRYGAPVVDIYERMRRETKAGNWDLRVRGYGVVDDDQPVLGPGQDYLHVGDVRWWTNIHPNPAGIAVIADEEVQVLQQHWPDTLYFEKQAATENLKFSEASRYVMRDSVHDANRASA